MKRLTVLMMAVVFGLALATSASATYISPTSPDGVGKDLQSILNGITTSPAGASSVDVDTDQVVNDAYWQVGGSGGAVTTMIIEVAGWANSNTFGIYDAYDPSVSVQLFGTAATTGSLVTLSILDTGEVVLSGTATGTFLTANAFGFYINTPNGTFYSDTGLNDDDFDHMVAFEGKGDTVKIGGWMPGPWNENEYVLAFEDTVNGGDKDYNDMVLMIESVSPVPEPATLLLLGAGLAGLGYFGRRKKNA